MVALGPLRTLARRSNVTLHFPKAAVRWNALLLTLKVQQGGQTSNQETRECSFSGKVRIGEAGGLTDVGAKWSESATEVKNQPLMSSPASRIGRRVAVTIYFQCMD